jgi:hypothetical protein
MYSEHLRRAQMRQLHSVRELEIYRILERWSLGEMDGRLHPYRLLGDDDLMIYIPLGSRPYARTISIR